MLPLHPDLWHQPDLPDMTMASDVDVLAFATVASEEVKVETGFPVDRGHLSVSSAAPCDPVDRRASRASAQPRIEVISERVAEDVQATYPAINVPASGTRREEMLLAPEVMRQVVLLWKMLSAVGQIEGTELLLQRLGKTKTNREFLAGIAKAMEAEKS